jgi:peptide/nickel transport system permease protein
LLRFVIRRFLFAVVTLFLMSVIVFGLSRAAGDPRFLYLSDYTTEEQWDQWGREMGLDRPLAIQYTVWLGRILVGDWGESLREARPVTTAILDRLPATLQLAGLGWAFTLGPGIFFGVLAATKRGTFWDFFSRAVTTFGQAVPQFWLGIILILVFSVELGWLPSGRRGGPSHYILPLIVLGPLTAAGTTRIVRSAMLEVLNSEFIRLARAKGVSNRMVIWKHAFRNALIAPLTYFGLTLAGLLTGTVLVETVFAWPGIGRLAIESVNQNDFPLLMGIVLLFTVIYLGVNFLVDIMYAFADPRIRYN